jgi:predicted pyridoxine 5'-phosphate oxidase superfamily flavin-nucleotide-binding protein
MLTAEIRRFIEGIPLAIVATADNDGQPHLALGSEVRVLDDDHLVFENWFCQTTLANVARNPRVAVAVMTQESGTGYQFVGTVALGTDAALLDGYVPGVEPPGEPQVLTRFVVRVEEVLAFCSGVHTDLPVGTLS